MKTVEERKNIKFLIIDFFNDNMLLDNDEFSKTGHSWLTRDNYPRSAATFFTKAQAEKRLTQLRKIYGQNFLEIEKIKIL